MISKVMVLANLLMIQYFLTSHYRVAHKWAWLGVSAVVLGALLAVWNSRQGDGPAAGGRREGNP